MRPVGRHWRIGFAVVSLVFLAVGAKVELECLAAYLFEQRIASRYASTLGQGTSAELKAIGFSRGRAVTWALRVTYRYSAAGVDYSGFRCGLEGVFGRFDGRAVAETAANRFPGSTVTIYYNSDNPSDCYMLQPHRMSDLVAPGLLFLGGLPGTILGATMMIRTVRSERAR